MLLKNCDDETQITDFLNNSFFCFTIVRQDFDVDGNYEVSPYHDHFEMSLTYNSESLPNQMKCVFTYPILKDRVSLICDKNLFLNKIIIVKY